MAQTEISITRTRGRAELISALAEARSGVRADAGDLGDLVNVPRRIRRSLNDSHLKRTATALVVGLIGARLFSRNASDSKSPDSGWIQRIFPNFDYGAILQLLLNCYLEPERVDLLAVLRKRLREYFE